MKARGKRERLKTARSLERTKRERELRQRGKKPELSESFQKGERERKERKKRQRREQRQKEESRAEENRRKEERRKQSMRAESQPQFARNKSLCVVQNSSVVLALWTAVNLLQFVGVLGFICVRVFQFCRIPEKLPSALSLFLLCLIHLCLFFCCFALLQQWMLLEVKLVLKNRSELSSC